MTLRLRLTLLYGACFLVAGAGLLGITYALFKSQSGPVNVGFPGANFQLPASANITGKVGSRLTITESVHGRTVTTTLPVGRRPPAAVLKQIRRSGQAQINAVAAQARGRLAALRAGDASSLLTYSGIALAGMALLSILLGWLLAGRALRPLRVMNTRARAITEESLHERLGIEQRADELGDLAATFDELLARLERAFDSQKRFVANASHELRTPLTLERTLLEVALADPEVSVESLRQVCERVIASTEEQERMIDALLTLARSQADPAEREEVALEGVADDALTAREESLSGVTLETDLRPAPIAADPALIERLVANLIDNAIVHNSATDPWIAVETRTEDGLAVLRVSNRGPEIASDQVEGLFEPFRRLQGDRTADHGGLGLGLSIVRAIAAAHGAALIALPREGGGLTVELRFAAARMPVTA